MLTGASARCGTNFLGLRERDAVTYIAADIFDWQPQHRYDAVFFGFWLSHVPPVTFDEFWAPWSSELLYAPTNPGQDPCHVARDARPSGRSSCATRNAVASACGSPASRDPTTAERVRL
jgi:hypothetical protein